MLSTLLVAMTLAVPCESLKTLALPDTTILSAARVPEGPFTATTTPCAVVRIAI